MHLLPPCLGNGSRESNHITEKKKKNEETMDERKGRQEEERSKACAIQMAEELNFR